MWGNFVEETWPNKTHPEQYLRLSWRLLFPKIPLTVGWRTCTTDSFASVLRSHFGSCEAGVIQLENIRVGGMLSYDVLPMEDNLPQYPHISDPAHLSRPRQMLPLAWSPNFHPHARSQHILWMPTMHCLPLIHSLLLCIRACIQHCKDLGHVLNTIVSPEPTPVGETCLESVHWMNKPWACFP